MTRRAGDAADAAEPDAGVLVAGDALAPRQHVVATAAEFWFWIGALPTCPYANVTVAGLCFPKVTEVVLTDEVAGTTLRIPTAGSLIKVSRERLALLAAKLPRKVLRFAGRNENGTESAMMVSIPTAADLAELAKHGGVVRPYVARDQDKPLADYVFAVHVADVSPTCRPLGTKLPPPLSKTGIVLPADARAVPSGERTADPTADTARYSQPGQPKQDPQPAA